MNTIMTAPSPLFRCSSLVVMSIALSSISNPFTDNDVFLDLGSRKGALVVHAATHMKFRESLGIELSRSRHDEAVAAAESAGCGRKVQLVCGDAAGELAVPLLERATVIWCSNLLFDDAFQEKLASLIARFPNVRMVASLKQFPGGIAGMDMLGVIPLEMTWTQVGTEQRGHPPLPGFPCPLYIRR